MDEQESRAPAMTAARCAIRAMSTDEEWKFYRLRRLSAVRRGGMRRTGWPSPNHPRHFPLAPVLAASVVPAEKVKRTPASNRAAVILQDFRNTPETDISLHRGIGRKGPAAEFATRFTLRIARSQIRMTSFPLEPLPG